MTTPTERIQRLREENEHATLATFIDRWTPQAAARALDLLADLFDRHFQGGLVNECCDGCLTYWPCADHTAALALLDTIDPEGARDA